MGHIPKSFLLQFCLAPIEKKKNNMIAEMRKLVCNPSDRSVCCDIEESEAEAEAEGNHEVSDAKAEGDHEESNPEAEGDHEESEAEAEGSSHDDQNKITDTLVSHDFPYKVGVLSELSEHELAGELWATDKNTLEFRKFTYEGDGPDAFFMIGTHDS